MGHLKDVEIIALGHSFTPFQVTLFYKYTIAGRIAVYRAWIQSGCRESVDEVLLALEVISSSGLRGFITDSTV
ncbi:MAG: hypothetical protein IKI42_10875 [Clostridia bacterium]|nr:hypothetical protein [Clostridia bacterium]